MYRDINNEMINKVIEFLNKVKDEKAYVTIEPLHIEEICGTFGGSVYGKAEMDIHIEFEDLYVKTNNILSTWEKITHNEEDL